MQTDAARQGLAAFAETMARQAGGRPPATTTVSMTCWGRAGRSTKQPVGGDGMLPAIGVNGVQVFGHAVGVIRRPCLNYQLGRAG